ncbi:MAG: peptidase MA family metallohydrolase, partial [Planctomycetota bacterium]
EFARFDAIAPGSAEGLMVAGRQLVFDRQYEEARATLGLAAAREPAWALPRAELGLLSMQDGREATAVADLRRAVELDPHDERTVFTLRLAEELAGWRRIETAHFTIRHPDGDAALVARLLAGVLDRMHEEVCARLGHEPAQKTLIDVMPDHRSFGVRVTGLPRIHTIAVCTGPTIAIEIPKEGPQSRHLGLFDPLAVLRHEYTHTVTLSMTRNRIPHWLTEAVAVALEDTPRTFETCQMLAAATTRGELFDLDGINWAFVRPRKPTDRAMAYAQGRWMVEFAEERFGWDAIRALLNSYAEGIREDEAMRRAFGVSREDFHAQFTRWAADEVRAWGLDPQPSLGELAMRLVEGDESLENFVKESQAERRRQVVKAWTMAVGAPGDAPFALRAREWPAAAMPPVKFDEATLRAFLAEFPQHPDLLELLLRRMRDSDTPETREILARYAGARPVDPFPHRVWAKLAAASSGDGLAAGGDERAFGHLRELDLRSDKDNVHAIAMARNRRAACDLERATQASERAVRMNPFDATVRELAAAVAVEAGRLDLAEMHIEALAALEPDRGIHKQRLERVRALRGGS